LKYNNEWLVIYIAQCHQILRLRALPAFLLSAHLSSYLLYSTTLSPILSSLQDIFSQILSSSKSYFSTWGRLLTIIKPLGKIFAFFTTWKNLCIFHPRQVAHYNKTTLKNHSHFSPLWNLCIFHLGRSTITMRILWKIIRIFHYFEESLHVLPGQIAYYNDNTLKNHLHFSSLWKFFVFFTWVGRPLQ